MKANCGVRVPSPVIFLPDRLFQPRFEGGLGLFDETENSFGSVRVKVSFVFAFDLADEDEFAAGGVIHDFDDIALMWAIRPAMFSSWTIDRIQSARSQARHFGAGRDGVVGASVGPRHPAGQPESRVFPLEAGQFWKAVQRWVPDPFCSVKSGIKRRG